MKPASFLTAILLCAFVVATNVSADIVHDEGLDGDLSGDFASPTPLDFTLNGNTILGQVGTNGNTGATNGSDADYFTVVIENGEQLDSILVDSRSGAGRSFFGYTEGNAFTGQGNGDIDGFVLFSNTSGEVLDDLIGGPGVLGPGTYSFWVQETSPGTVDYSFTFNVSVPEPSSMLLGLVACCGFFARRRKAV